MEHVHTSVIYAVKHSLTHVIWRHIKAHLESIHVTVTVMCVNKLLGCGFNWRYIFTYIVINVHRSVVSAINHLLVRVKWFQWFINICILHIPRIFALKFQFFVCTYVINSVQIGFCSTKAFVWKANCWNLLSGIWNHVEGTVSMCNLCDTEGGVKEKCSRNGGSGGP